MKIYRITVCASNTIKAQRKTLRGVLQFLRQCNNGAHATLEGFGEFDFTEGTVQQLRELIELEMELFPV